MANEEVAPKNNTVHKDRDWKQFHTPRNLASSIVLEVAEVLEIFQWKLDNDISKEDVEEIKDELADVFICLLLFAHSLDIDLIKAANKKIVKNEKKYPVEKAKGSSTKYTKLT